MTSRTAGKAADAGFTLIELLVVIAIVATLCAVGGLSARGIFDRLAVGRAKHKLESELSRLAFEAQRTGLDRTVTLESAGGKTSLVADGRKFSLGPDIRVEWVAAQEAGSKSSQGSIVFFGAGGASGGRLTLKSREATETIVVDWLTGRIKPDSGRKP